MAAIAETCRASYHVRSVSLPARSHPLTLSIEEQLDRLRSSKETSSSALTSLKNLYENIDDLLQLPLRCQDLGNEADRMLDGSLRLLDVCESTRDVFSRMKEILKEFESSLRRKRGGESKFTSEIEAYMNSRKKLRHVISKSLRNLKTKEKKRASTAMNKDSNFVKMIREGESISFTIIESLLRSISQAMSKSRTSRWSVFSKFLQLKREEDEDDKKELQKMEAELLVLKSSRVQLQDVVKGLQALESSIREIEENLDSFYRQLLKTRVSLLNILNN